MRTFTAVVERDPDTGTYVGYIPGFPGAHSQGDTVEELKTNLREVIEMLLEMVTLLSSPSLSARRPSASPNE